MQPKPQPLPKPDPEPEPAAPTNAGAIAELKERIKLATDGGTCESITILVRQIKELEAKCHTCVSPDMC